MIDVNTDNSCIFCQVIDGDKKSPLKVIERYRSAVCMFDGHPVTRFHMLIIPIRHTDTYFDLTFGEKFDIDMLLVDMCEKMTEKDETITGFNIGWNSGESAGQTVPHAHCHVIPRRDGDIDDPTGGVRGCIPEQRIYR